jgi:EpsI family protein
MGVRPYLGVIAAGVLLLAGGFSYRALAAYVGAALANYIRLDPPLSTLPLAIGEWEGRDIAFDPAVLRVASFDDEYVNRVYAHRARGVSVSVFVGYVGRPRTTFGHRPEVCYAAHGWNEVRQSVLTLDATNGQSLPAVWYQFEHPTRITAPLQVLATYLINGRYFQHPHEFQRWHVRNPGLLGERPGYLTRIQVTLPASADRAADLELLADLLTLVAEPVTGLMPYWEVAD